MEFSRSEYWGGSLSLLQGIFPTQESNQGLLHCRWILYQLSYERGECRGEEDTSVNCVYLPVWARVGAGDVGEDQRGWLGHLYK